MTPQIWKPYVVDFLKFWSFYRMFSNDIWLIVWFFSESSQAAKYGGCFTAETTVQTSEGVSKKLSDLKIGEQILSVDLNTFELKFSELLLFLHFNPDETRQFVHVTLKSGKTLTVTPTHLVLTGSLTKNRIVFAGDLKPSDTMLTSDSKNKLREDVIIEIKQVMRKGVYAPLTEAGTVVVNDVLASCYAVVESQSLAHWAYSPLRLIHNFKESLSRLWSLVNRPFSGWNEAPKSISAPSIGVHWYGRMLYSLVDFFYPKILYWVIWKPTIFRFEFVPSAVYLLWMYYTRCEMKFSGLFQIWNCS